MKPFTGCVTFYYNGWRKNGVGYIERSSIRKNTQFIDKYKIFVPKAGTGSPDTDLVNAFIVQPNSASTDNDYLTVGPFKSQEETNNALAYMHTKFFPFHGFHDQDYTECHEKHLYDGSPPGLFTSLTDEDLYAKYALSGRGKFNS